MKRNTVVKAFKTVERVVFTDSDKLSPEGIARRTEKLRKT